MTRSNQQANRGGEKSDRPLDVLLSCRKRGSRPLPAHPALGGTPPSREPEAVGS